MINPQKRQKNEEQRNKTDGTNKKQIATWQDFMQLYW